MSVQEKEAEPMPNVTYVVRSDYDMQNDYEEFDDEQEAIEYAKEIACDHSWVERVEWTGDPETGHWCEDENADIEEVWSFEDMEEEGPQG